MKKLNLPGKTNAEIGKGKVSETWYFARLAFMAIPWNARNSSNPKGTLFRKYYLLRARNIESAFNKADRILSVSEHCDGSGSLKGKRVCFKKVGVLNLAMTSSNLSKSCFCFLREQAWAMAPANWRSDSTALWRGALPIGGSPG